MSTIPTVYRLKVQRPPHLYDKFSEKKKMKNHIDPLGREEKNSPFYVHWF